MDFYDKNHCEIQVRTILVCTLYLIKTVFCYTCKCIFMPVIIINDVECSGVRELEFFYSANEIKTRNGARDTRERAISTGLSFQL
jgi:hypothetical protein